MQDRYRVDAHLLVTEVLEGGGIRGWGHQRVTDLIRLKREKRV
jgi:hypothetical protein